MFMMPMPPTMREMPATSERMPETMERREPAGWVISSPLRTVKLVSPDLAAVRDSRMVVAVSSREPVFSTRILIC